MNELMVKNIQHNDLHAKMLPGQLAKASYTTDLSTSILIFSIPILSNVHKMRINKQDQWRRNHGVHVGTKSHE